MEEGKDVARIFVKDNGGKEEGVREQTDEVDQRKVIEWTNEKKKEEVEEEER